MELRFIPYLQSIINDEYSMIVHIYFSISTCFLKRFLDKFDLCFNTTNKLISCCRCKQEASSEHYHDYGMTCHAHICTYSSWCFRTKLSECCQTQGHKGRGMLFSLAVSLSLCFLFSWQKEFPLLLLFALVYCFSFHFICIFYSTFCFATFRMTRKRSLHLMTTTTTKGGKNVQPNELVPKKLFEGPCRQMNIKKKQRKKQKKES